MKYILLMMMVSAPAITMAQAKQVIIKDTVVKTAVIKNTVLNRNTAGSKTTVKAAIESELMAVVAKYKNEPNTNTTWIKIKADAENVLYPYFKNGKLLGTKIDQAFFVKMGNETMTVTDIANHKMILLVGVAIVKPAIFETIRIEQVVQQ